MSAATGSQSAAESSRREGQWWRTAVPGSGRVTKGSSAVYTASGLPWWDLEPENPILAPEYSVQGRVNSSPSVERDAAARGLLDRVLWSPRVFAPIGIDRVWTISPPRRTKPRRKPRAKPRAKPRSRTRIAATTRRPAPRSRDKTATSPDPDAVIRAAQRLVRASHKTMDRLDDARTRLARSKHRRPARDAFERSRALLEEEGIPLDEAKPPAEEDKKREGASQGGSSSESELPTDGSDGEASLSEQKRPRRDKLQAECAKPDTSPEAPVLASPERNGVLVTVEKLNNFEILLPGDAPRRGVPVRVDITVRVGDSVAVLDPCFTVVGPTRLSANGCSVRVPTVDVGVGRLFTFRPGGLASFLSQPSPGKTPEATVSIRVVPGGADPSSVEAYLACAGRVDLSCLRWNGGVAAVDGWYHAYEIGRKRVGAARDSSTRPTSVGQIKVRASLQRQAQAPALAPTVTRPALDSTSTRRTALAAADASDTEPLEVDTVDSGSNKAESKILDAGSKEVHARPVRGSAATLSPGAWRRLNSAFDDHIRRQIWGDPRPSTPREVVFPDAERASSRDPPPRGRSLRAMDAVYADMAMLSNCLNQKLDRINKLQTNARSLDERSLLVPF